MKTTTWIIVLGIIAIVFGGLGYRSYLQKNSAWEALYTYKSAQNLNGVLPAETANWNTYANSNYRFEFKYPPEYKTILTTNMDNGCDGPWDEITIKDTASAKILMDANNGTGCIGGFPSIPVSTGKIGAHVTKSVALDENNDLDPSNDKRYVTYTFSSFSSGPIYDPAEEQILDKIFSTFELTK